MMTGGIFLYPPTESYPSGKLRLVYECNPVSFIIEQAGGKAFDGHRRIMSVVPEVPASAVTFLLRIPGNGSTARGNAYLRLIQPYLPALLF